MNVRIEKIVDVEQTVSEVNINISEAIKMAFKSLDGLNPPPNDVFQKMKAIDEARQKLNLLDLNLERCYTTLLEYARLKVEQHIPEQQDIEVQEENK